MPNPSPSFYHLAEDLLLAGFTVGIVGLDSDKQLGGLITATCADEHCIDLTGYTRSVRELLNLFSCARLLVTNDGGPGHFAPLADLPSLVFFGPETPVLYSPLGNGTHAISTALPCSPCLTAFNHRASPCDGDNQCLKQLAPERVIQECRAILGIH